jgi:hypothetical protein
LRRTVKDSEPVALWAQIVFIVFGVSFFLALALELLGVDSGVWHTVKGWMYGVSAALIPVMVYVAFRPDKG